MCGILPEWWDQYEERMFISSDYQTYRSVMFMIGSLFHDSGRNTDDIETDRIRERYVDPIKTHIKSERINPDKAIFICGAAYGASDVESSVSETTRSGRFLRQKPDGFTFGLSSSFAAIEYQFAKSPNSLNGRSNMEKSQGRKDQTLHSIREKAENVCKGKVHNPSAAQARGYG